MVKFGKKFFFSEIPQDEEVKPKKIKKPKKVKKPKKERKKIDFKKILTSIKEKLLGALEIIIAVLKKIWPIIIIIIVLLLIVFGIKSCANSSKKSKNNQKQQTPKDETKPDIINEVNISINEELPTIDKFVKNIDKFETLEKEIIFDQSKVVNNHYEEVGKYVVTIKIDNQYDSSFFIKK